MADPIADLSTVYTDDYYQGTGADKCVNYVFDALHPDTSAQADGWLGVLQSVSELLPVQRTTRWLDYGCGTGSLVRFLRAEGHADAIGLEQGWSQAMLDRLGVPHITPGEVAQHAGTFDVVTAIEVLEHAIDPLEDLRAARTLLRPGGLLFLTTGNARPYRGRMTSWRYVMPDVHISFFEPATLARAMASAGFQPAFPGFGAGWPNIYRAKLHSTLRIRRRHRTADLLPWQTLARGLDRRLQLAQQPVGWAI